MEIFLILLLDFQQEMELIPVEREQENIKIDRMTANRSIIKEKDASTKRVMKYFIFMLELESFRITRPFRIEIVTRAVNRPR